MASNRRCRTMKLVLFLKVSMCTLFVHFGYSCAGSIEADSDGRCFPLLFAFGDSLSDTGNAQHIFPLEQKRAAMLPYGQTFFNRPNDRFSDGRLLIDFIAQALRLPLLNPYVKSAGTSFQQGVNLATSGATATDIAFLVPYTLRVQLYWLRKFKANILERLGSNDTLQSSLPPLDSISKALYVVWIGGNDYNARLFVYNMTMDQLTKSVDEVMNAMSSNLEDLYTEGARAILIVNLPPVGCTPEVLTFVRGHPHEYDSVGCFRPYNEVFRAHNKVLKELWHNLTRLHPDATFVHADYYAISYDILRHPLKYGMANVMQACCGLGGSYNFDFSLQCGMILDIIGALYSPPACKNPAIYSNWDGIHPTEAFSQIVAAAFLTGQYIEPADAFQNCTFDFSMFL
ncbi:hypothetical protein O6H91_09G014700 [Diphasiastrum complanatum]|uniref:Uncharacterized protein n=2 Tax=Diphasiastrum complanatum TaxID=34168 RepID=A0ACC2CLG4_DIPCM|nr:hypothetical protein O6H91_09G014400 [Diphasiastrum complanatum]KAJ7542852.1 hypothetical protein O6H91_09G014700 [Diphasiastrum complanatum]